MMDHIVKDLRFGLRRLRARPTQSAVLVGTLALAIGATTAILGIALTVLQRPLPFAEPDRLVFAWAVGADEEEVWLSPPEIEDLRSAEGLFSGVIALTDKRFTLTGSGDPLEVPAVTASADLFPLLGVRPQVGRGFSPEEDRPGADPVVVLSDGLWRRRFGADPNVVGQPIQLDGKPYEVVGVMPKTFRILPPSSVFPENAELWVPYQPHLPEFFRENRSVRFVHAMGRLAPGVSTEVAASRVAALSQRLRSEYAADYEDGRWRLIVRGVRDQLIGSVRPAIVLLVVAVCLLLLIACVNIANVQLATTSARERELSIRSTVGAGRLRLFRQLFMESLALALIGGVLGLVVTLLAIRWLTALGASSIPRLDEVGLDPVLLAVAAGVTLATAVLFGLLPGIRGTRLQLAPALNAGGRSIVGPSKPWLRGSLVILEVALALIVLVGAGLTWKSFDRVLSVDPGFRTDRVITMRISLPGSRYPERAQQRAFFERILEQVEALPQVSSVAAVTQLPLSGAQLGSSFQVEQEDEPFVADLRGVTPGYFRTLGIPLLAGRDFASTDFPDAPPVAIVDETLAKTHWPDRDPVGEQIVWQRTGDVLEVVGVVGAVRHNGPEAPAQETIYRPSQQYVRETMVLVAHTGDDPLEVANLARARVWELDPAQPVAEVETLEGLANRAVAERRFSTFLMMLFSLLALLLAMLGLYGILTQWVQNRRPEIGVRFALGADQRTILGLIMRQGMLLVCLGLIVGMVGALLSVRFVEALMFEVSTTDPLVFLGVAVVLLTSAALFAWIPARRAAHLDPASMLSGE